MVNDIITIIDFVKKEYDRDLTVYNQEFLISSVKKRKARNGIKDWQEYASLFMTNRQEALEFLDSLNVSYTDFFREPLTFGLLEQIILPSIIANKKMDGEIRVWSAGCANGKEAYSIAMLLNELIEAGNKEITFRIFATDISAQALAEGTTGIFDEASVQTLKVKYVNKFFTAKNRDYWIKDSIKKCISFSTYNMLDPLTDKPPESIYGDFDLVFCSNLLIYYNTANQEMIINKLKKALSNKGYLVTSEAEKSLIKSFSGLRMLEADNCVFQAYKRRLSD